MKGISHDELRIHRVTVDPTVLGSEKDYSCRAEIREGR